MKLSIMMKLSLLMAAAVIITAGSINAIYQHGTQQILIDRVTNDLSQEIDFFRYPLEAKITQIREDIQLLAQLQMMPDVLHASGKTTSLSREQLADVMMQMMRTTNYYRYITLITPGTNQELLKVERRDQEIQRAASSRLETRTDTYLRTAMATNGNEVTLSGLHLLSKNGELVRPYTLVLDVAIPIYSAQQQLLGIVEIEADFGNVLYTVAHQSETDDVLYIANEQGDYLENPDISKMYASALGHDWRIQHDYPSLAPLLSNAKTQEAVILPDDTAHGNVLVLKKFYYDIANPARFLAMAVVVPYQRTISEIERLEYKGLAFSTLMTIAMLLGGMLLLRVLIRPLGRIATMVVRYRRGEKDIQLPLDSPDEIGVLAREFFTMMEQKNGEEWVKNSLASITELLLGYKNLGPFATTVIEKTAQAIDAQLGVFYISSDFLQDRSGDTEKSLCLLGAYGYPHHRGLPTAFRIGEGLVGQCAASRLPMRVNDVPENYIHITSATGEGLPKHILLLPVIFENSVVAVLEFASFGAFTPLHRLFLDQLCFNIGVIINAISASQRTEELLEEARMAAEELQHNEEELKAQQEELQASNEEMEEKNKALEEQNAQIRHQTMVLSETKRAVEEKAAELERANSYKSEFLANMSHELRTPLNSLLILARLLAANEEGNLTPEQVEEATIIHHGGLELLNLINDILDLSKVEAGKMLMTMEDVLLAGVVKRLQQQFAPVATQANITFSVQMEVGLPAALHTDGQRIEQILKNLLSNAFKFTQAGSVVLDIASMGERIAFRVTDTGIGIDDKKLRDIFEAFQQEDGSTGRHYGGTGLGLTIARKFAHLLGGEIQVASSKGVGSSFTLLLPIRKGMAEPLALPAMPASTLVEKNMPEEKLLLIIEDDHPFAMTLAKIARKRGYKCLEAADAKTGLQLAMQYPVTAIILDLKLPDGNGIQVLEQLRQNEKTRDIPVHIITGYDDSDSTEPLRHAAIAYLTKPLTPTAIDQLFAQMEAVLHGKVKKLLVVEDDRSTQSAIRSLLKDSGIEITVAATGGEALSYMAHEIFDGIILDLALPDMTGLEWLEQLDRTDGASPPIVIYTARDLSEEEHRRLNAYTNSIVIKGAHSAERLRDEVTLFLHSVESTLPSPPPRMLHDTDTALQGHTVLLVDDDLRNTFALTKLLRKYGMKVVIADNGEMALQKLREEKSIELVMMDIMMPVMDGYETIAAMRADKTFAALPVIALTARAMPQEQEKCMAAGANDYLTKPVDIDRLLALLRVWLCRQESAA